MSRVYTSIFIGKPVEEVFKFVTNPGYWPQWHLSSVGVSGAVDHSLEVGEKVAEDFLVAGGRGRVVWTVLERSEPSHWKIEGYVDRGGYGTITYTLTPKEGGTQFERVFDYKMPHFLLDFLDRLFIRSRIDDESTRAVAKLKQVLEAQ